MSLSEELVQYFVKRKADGTTYSEDELISMAMRSKEFFFQAIGIRCESFGMRLFIEAFILKRATFLKELLQSEINMLLMHFKKVQRLHSLPSRLISPELRRGALQFFIEHPKYMDGEDPFYEMLLLLFCDCKSPCSQLSKHAFLHIIENIKKSSALFKALTASILANNFHLGVQFCFNIFHYSSLVLGNVDASLLDIITEPLRLLGMGWEEHWPYRTSSSATYLEKSVSQLSKTYSIMVKSGMQFILHCDHAFTQEVIRKMMNICTIGNQQWDTFAYLMNLLPIPSHYSIISSTDGPIESLATSRYIPFSSSFYFTDLYFLSRFSRHPSTKIRVHALSLVPALHEHEPSDYSVKDWTGEYLFPDEIILKILTQTDPITQLLSVPLVCKAWNNLRQQLLMKSRLIHALFMKDIGNYGFEKILCYLPWRAVFRSPSQVVNFFGRIGNVSCDIPNGHAYTGVCRQYLLNMPAPQLDPLLTNVDQYAIEYVRLGACNDWKKGSRLQLYHPPSLTIEQYGGVIRKLTRDLSVVPRIPREYILENMIELYAVINDDYVLEAILKSDLNISLDKICANILVQQVAIPPGLIRLFSSKTVKFKDVFAGAIPLPLEIDLLGTDLDLMMNILELVSTNLQKRACELLVHVLCRSQNDLDLISLIITAVRNSRLCYFSTYPLLYMLNNTWQFSTDHFKLVQRVILESKQCSEDDFGLPLLHSRFSISREIDANSIENAIPTINSMHFVRLVGTSIN